MQNQNEYDHRQILVKKFELKRRDLKSKIYNKNLSLDERWALVLKLSELPRNSSVTRLRNRCAITGRARGYYRKFKICRNFIRSLAGEGKLPGVTKSSW